MADVHSIFLGYMTARERFFSNRRLSSLIFYPLFDFRDIICADVRPVLREVFRDVEYLPPLVSCPTEKNDESELLGQVEWVF